jgi:integrase
MRVFERKGKRGSIWYIDYTHKGRRMMEAVGPDRKLAEAVARKRETEIFEGRFFPEKKKSRYRFKDLAAEFMERHSKRNKRSWKRDKVSLNSLMPYFGNTYLDNITPRMIESYRIKREKDGVKDPTINREHGLMKSMFNRAIAWDMTGDNPAKKVWMPKEKARNRFLTREEIQRLLSASETKWAPYLKPILVMALSTGVRKGEILRLT